MHQRLIESDWKIKRIVDMHLEINQFMPLSSGTWINAPISIIRKNAIINPLSSDGKCFMYAICTKLFGGNDKYYYCNWGEYKEQIEQSYNWDGISFHTPDSQIKFSKKTTMPAWITLGLEMMVKYICTASQRITRLPPQNVFIYND